jgi:hypothetical protein
LTLIDFRPLLLFSLILFIVFSCHCISIDYLISFIAISDIALIDIDIFIIQPFQPFSPFIFIFDRHLGIRDIALGRMEGNTSHLSEITGHRHCGLIFLSSE